MEEDCEGMAWTLIAHFHSQTAVKEPVIVIGHILETAGRCQRLRGMHVLYEKALGKENLVGIKGYSQDPSLRERAKDAIVENKEKTLALCRGILPWHGKLYYDVVITLESAIRRYSGTPLASFAPP